MSSPEYLRIVRDCDLKVGDRVIITRAAGNREKGWILSWASSMHQYVGKTYTVSSIDEIKTKGITLEGLYDVQFSIPWYFPPFVLERQSCPHNKRKKS